MSFRDQLKEKIAYSIYEVESKDLTQEIERNELGIRLLKFLKYEQDPAFEKWFNEFCVEKSKEEKKSAPVQEER